MTDGDTTFRPGPGKQMTREEEWRFAEKAMGWSGWGSPVGLGIFLVALALTALLIRFTFVGF